MRIGIAGTGRMGTAIARRLLEKGHQVAAWNRTIENAHDAREAGARWSPRLADLVNEHDIVISFLLDNAAIERVYLGPQGVLDGRAEGRLFVDMSTVSPATHSRIAAALARRDAGFIECPVSGSIPLAQSGSLVGFAGGDAADFARAAGARRPLPPRRARRPAGRRSAHEACREPAAGRVLASVGRIAFAGGSAGRPWRARDRPPSARGP